MRTSPPGSTVTGMAPGDNRAVSPHGTRRVTVGRVRSRRPGPKSARQEPESCSVRYTGSRRSTPHSPNSSTTEARRHWSR
jgi:hypothetical protein